MNNADTPTNTRTAPQTPPLETIRNCRQLRRTIAAGSCDFRLMLMGGASSRKTITIRPHGRFHVENHIDGSIQLLSGRGLYTQSNIGEAMQKGSFFAEGNTDE